MPLRRTKRSDGHQRPRWKDGSHAKVENTDAEQSRCDGLAFELNFLSEPLKRVRLMLGPNHERNVSTRDRPARTGADARIEESGAIGELCLALRPYGRRFKLRFQYRRQVLICQSSLGRGITGSAFATFCIVPEASFRTSSGAPRFYGVTGTSGGSVERGFCGDCGSPLFSRVAMAPGFLFVKAGALDDASWISPASSFWGASAQPWATPASELAVHEGNPG